MKRSKNLVATAHHEAGHAVAAFLLKRRLRSVTIVPNSKDGSLGSTNYRFKSGEVRDLSYMSRRHVEDHIIICFAGGIAEQRFRGRANHRASRSDHFEAVELALEHIGRADEARAYADWLFVRTKNLLLHTPNAWRAVKAIATALLKFQTLSGKKVAETIHDVMTRDVRKYLEQEKARLRIGEAA